jgi:phosphonate transport system ATP-binding protein
MSRIQFTNASVTYPGGLTALRDVDLTIEEGELVVVVGLSGAGKSTLLRSINGLVPVRGSVTVGGREVVGASHRQIRDIRSDVGMIFQTFNLVNRSRVINNVLMGRLSMVPRWRSALGLWPAEDKEIALQSLERVGIVEKAYIRASDLSGGQQQRVGIARALAQDPRILLADEPVASLDPVTSHVVMRDLQRINGELGITTIINLHFLDLARQYGKRLIGLRDGEVVFDGDIADVDDEVFRGIYGRAITPDDIKKEARTISPEDLEPVDVVDDLGVGGAT